MRTLFLTLSVLSITMLTPAHAMPGSQTVYADVNGLVCDFCARALEKVFGKQEEVSSIDVNLDTKIVTIDFKEGQSLDDETIRRLITDSGYNVVNIRHDKQGDDKTDTPATEMQGEPENE